MEEELQQSVLLSQDPDWVNSENETSHLSNKGITVATVRQAHDSATSEYPDADSDRDASGEDIEEDAEGEDEFDALNPHSVASNPDEDTSEDAEGDEDDEFADEDEDEDDVVRFRRRKSVPDVEDESDVSEPPSAADDDSEGEQAWEDARDAAEEDDRDSEAAPLNTCAFCKQDEEHDPSEDFEAFLSCVRCGENGKSHAHQ